MTVLELFEPQMVMPAPWHRDIPSSVNMMMQMIFRYMNVSPLRSLLIHAVPDGNCEVFICGYAKFKPHFAEPEFKACTAGRDEAAATL
jgi:hypothetical protein